MNGLTLRINPRNSSKMKNIGFAPVTFIIPESIDGENELYNDFLNAVTADEQLIIIKKILENNLELGVIKFLALVFLQAEVKHPVKCFLVRHVTRSDYLQPLFSQELSQHIRTYMAENYCNYLFFKSIVPKIATCIENFPAGVVAIQTVETDLALYLMKCLECCVNTIRDVKTLAPTEKNEIFSLAHLSLRLILCIIQKVNEKNVSILISIFKELRLLIKDIIFNEDTPMDTKTLSGILLLTMENLENGPDAWIKILDTSQADDYTSTLLHNEAAELSLHSAIVTVVPLDRLLAHSIGDTPALFCLADHIIAIGERTCSESVITLSVSRAMVQISKWAARLPSGGLAMGLMERVLGFCWAHLEHYMDSVRHLAAQALANVTKCAARLDAEGSPVALQELLRALQAVSRNRKAYYVGVGALATQLSARKLLALMPTLIDDVTAALQYQHVQASASTALELVLDKHAHECNTQTLYSSWVEPCLKQAAIATAPGQAALLQKLMARAVKLDDGIIQYIIPEINRLVSSSPANIRSVLILVHVARKAGLPPSPPEGEAGEAWRGVLPYSVLYTAATHSDDDIRSLCLALVAESPKSTEWYHDRELNLVLHFLKYNINAQAPNFRQHMLALFNKFMKRLGDSYKLLKRQTGLNVEDDRVSYYLSFVERLRALCFNSLMPGANYGRRTVALQLLVWGQDLHLEGYNGSWREEYVSVLLQRLEDPYDGNRSLALRALRLAPTHLLQSKKYRVSIDLEDILLQASSLKPTDCVSAAYKLMLLMEKLPESILQANPRVTSRTQQEPVSFALVSLLLQRLKGELCACTESLVQGARQAPMYGLLHCLRRPLMILDAKAITSDNQWSALIDDIIQTCYSITSLVSSVVNNSSPEGHLPMDAGVTVTDTGNSGGIVLADGRPVTAQMLLLCAWRSVKEVSLLLGTIASRLTIQGEGQESGTLSQDQVLLVGEHFTKLLAETKHRGAFEQAYVGFTELLARLWQCRSPGLHGWGQRGVRSLLDSLSRPGTDPTRRSAGLPFMIQALVITELQVKGNPTCLHECMNTLLKLARTTSIEQTDKDNKDSDEEISKENKSSINSTENSEESVQANSSSVSKDSLVENRTHCMNINEESVQANSSSVCKNSLVESRTHCMNINEESVQANSSSVCNDGLVESRTHCMNINEESVQANSSSVFKDGLVESRTHCMNILRALFRNSALEESVAGYVGEGLMAALEGFERDTWMERNAATLLFSALMSRVFGPAAARGRDSMTGRIFFLRYPKLYDYILKKLEEASHTIEHELSPGLFPVLTLLGRLYPSALEGVESALRLRALAPKLLPAAAAPPRAARIAAAAPLASLLPPHRYIPHIESTLATIGSSSIKRNYCHGLLLQITKLLAAYPEDLVVDHDQKQRVAEGIKGSIWILEQATGKLPCYMIADEYVKMINLFIWKFSTYIEKEQEMLETIKVYLLRILFAEEIPPITSGREICLANIAYLYIVILNKQWEFIQNSGKRITNQNSTPEDIISFILKCIAHDSYEVVLSALNYLLILSKNLEIDCYFQQHLSSFILNETVRPLLRNEFFTDKLCEVLKSSKYLECMQKTLKILSLEDNTQKYIVELKLGRKAKSNEEIVETLIDCIQNEHENLTHIYLESLGRFVSSLLSSNTDILSDSVILDVIRVVFDCCTSENNDNTRRAAATFLQNNLRVLLDMEFSTLSEEEKFELEATLHAAIASCLEDDDAAIRQGAADAVGRLSPHGGEQTPRGGEQTPRGGEQTPYGGEQAPYGGVVASRAGEWLRERAANKRHALPLLLTLALLDFKSEVCLADELSDEYRVFDQNERYNINLEETIWTSECADKIIALSSKNNISIPKYVRAILDHPIYCDTFNKLCNNNLVLFKQMLEDNTMKYKNDIVNPKIELFACKLLGKQFI